MSSIRGPRARRIQRFGADWNDVPEEINRMIIDKTLSGSGSDGALLASVNKDTRRLVKEAKAERRQAELRELRLDTTRWLLDEASVTSAWWHTCPFRFSPLARIYVTGAPNAARAKLCISAFIDHLGSAASCECDDLKNPETIDLVHAIINLKKVAAPIPDGDMANLVKRHAKPAVLSLYGPISLWDTSGVTDMRGAFTLLKTDTSPINARLWDTSGVKDMSGAFSGTKGIVRGIGRWNTSKVTDMSSMFVAFSVTDDISSWDTARVTDMGAMFVNASSFNQDISRWDTSRVKDTKFMFLNAAAFNRDISGWNLTSLRQSTNMFDGASAMEAKHKPLIGLTVRVTGPIPRNMPSLACELAGKGDHSKHRGHERHALCSLPVVVVHTDTDPRKPAISMKIHMILNTSVLASTEDHASELTSYMKREFPKYAIRLDLHSRGSASATAPTRREREKQSSCCIL
jgi:surface protein